MKPVPQVSPNERDATRDGGSAPERRNFPATDYNLQATADAHTSSLAIREKNISELRTFRKVSREFLGTETNRDYVFELLLFTLISGISAWPIISAIVWMTRLVRNY